MLTGAILKQLVQKGIENEVTKRIDRRLFRNVNFLFQKVKSVGGTNLEYLSRHSKKERAGQTFLLSRVLSHPEFE